MNHQKIISRNAFLGGILIVFVFLFFVGFARTPLTGDSGTTVIKDVRIFDGLDVIPKGTVVFQEGKITAAGKDASIPAGAKVIDGSGKTLLPGLFDAHIHLISPDLLLVNGDPTEDVKATREILEVWKDGVRVDRAKYLAKVKKAIESGEKLKAAPPPEYALPGLISDFEDAEVTAKFGAGWSISTDAMMGGKSKADYKIVKGGARGSQGSLLITGDLVGNSPMKWAGALFSPGKRMMMPANLSFKKSISFWAKGDSKAYAVLIFAQSLGFQPAIQTFTAGPKWKEYAFSYESFGLEGYDIMGIFIGSSMTEGTFSLQIDDVRLK